MATFSETIISETTNVFSTFLFHFLDLDSTLEIFKKKMTLLAHVFLNFQTPKSLVR